MDIIIIIFGGKGGGTGGGSNPGCGGGGAGCGCLLLLFVVALIAGSGSHSSSTTNYHSAPPLTSAPSFPFIITPQPLDAQTQQKLSAVVKRWLTAIGNGDIQTLRALTCAKGQSFISTLQKGASQMAGQVSPTLKAQISQLDVHISQSDGSVAEINNAPGVWLQYEGGWKVCAEFFNKP